MKAIEAANPELRDVLPQGYQRIAKSTLSELLRLFAPSRQLSGDAFGLIYEDFLSNFAASEARLGGEFFTPYSIVRLIVEIIEPFTGRSTTQLAGREACCSMRQIRQTAQLLPGPQVVGVRE